MISTTLDFTSWHGIFFTNFNVLLLYNNEASFKGVSPRSFSFRVYDDNSFYYEFSQLQAFHITFYRNLLTLENSIQCHVSFHMHLLTRKTYQRSLKWLEIIQI